MKLRLFYKSVLKNGGAGAQLHFKFTSFGSSYEPLLSHIEPLFTDWLENAPKSLDEADQTGDGVWVQDGQVRTLESESNLAVVRPVRSVLDRLFKHVEENETSGVLFEETF